MYLQKILVFASLRDGVELKPHQEEGVRKMIAMEKLYEGGILADEASTRGANESR